MNRALLEKNVQDFITENYSTDISKIIFRGSPFKSVTVQELAVQLSGKKKAQKKLPTWFKTNGILYPPGVNLEQASSEITAKYKASLVKGNTLADITGGFGVDTYYFSKSFDEVVHCELNPSLSELVAHNSSRLGAGNISSVTGDGIEYIKNSPQVFSWIYIDPSRRDDSGGRVFRLSDCLPNLPLHLDLLCEKSSGVMIKTSPLLDLQAGITSLRNIHEVHIVAVDNDVKELLWILNPFPSEGINIKTINFRKKGTEIYENIFGNSFEANFGPPLTYLYEPNAAIMKSGLFGSLADDFKLSKLHPNSHLFTSKDLKKDFPGRRFKILEVLSYNRKTLKKALKFDRANITTRNFPERVDRLRKQFRLRDGGGNYLFFTTTGQDEKICVVCEKVL